MDAVDVWIDPIYRVSRGAWIDPSNLYTRPGRIFYVNGLPTHDEGKVLSPPSS